MNSQISSSQNVFSKKHTILYDSIPFFIHFRSRDNQFGVARITVVWKFHQNFSKIYRESMGKSIFFNFLKKMRGSRQHFAFHGRQNRQISTFGRVNRRSSWEKTHRRRSAWRDLDQSGNSSGISKMCWKISDFMKISKTLRPVRFGAATTNDERGAGRGSARTIGQLP